MHLLSFSSGLVPGGQGWCLVVRAGAWSSGLVPGRQGWCRVALSSAPWVGRGCPSTRGRTPRSRSAARSAWSRRLWAVCLVERALNGCEVVSRPPAGAPEGEAEASSPRCLVPGWLLPPAGREAVGPAVATALGQGCGSGARVCGYVLVQTGEADDVTSRPPRAVGDLEGTDQGCGCGLGVPAERRVLGGSLARLEYGIAITSSSSRVPRAGAGRDAEHASCKPTRAVGACQTRLAFPSSP